MLINKDQVLNFIPHRAPFLFIDGVEKIELVGRNIVDRQPVKKLEELIGGKVYAKFAVKSDLEILAGHFPGNPILPGVVQVEMMAQASCFLLYFYDKIPVGQVEVALLGVEGAKFRMPVVPGMNLDIEAICTKIRRNFFIYDAKILCQGKLVSEASLMASIKL